MVAAGGDAHDRRSCRHRRPRPCPHRRRYPALRPRLDGHLRRPAPGGGAPRLDRRGVPPAGPYLCRRHRGGAGGRQYRPHRRHLRRGPADDLARAAEPHPRHPPCRPGCRGRGRGGAVAAARGGRCAGSGVSAVLRRPWLGDAGRQPVDQCRRLERAALRQQPRAMPWPGSGAARRRGDGPDVGTAQGQRRLRPEGSVHRRRRHAGHHHRRGAETRPETPRLCHGNGGDAGSRLRP